MYRNYCFNFSSFRTRLEAMRKGNCSSHHMVTLTRKYALFLEF